LASTEWILEFNFTVLHRTSFTISPRKATSKSALIFPNTPATLPASAPCGFSKRFAAAERRPVLSGVEFGNVWLRSSAAKREDSFQAAQPYAAAKVYAHWMTRIYREGYHLYARNGILFNHESPRPVKLS